MSKLKNDFILVIAPIVDYLKQMGFREVTIDNTGEMGYSKCYASSKENLDLVVHITFNFTSMELYVGKSKFGENPSTIDIIDIEENSKWLRMDEIGIFIDGVDKKLEPYFT